MYFGGLHLSRGKAEGHSTYEVRDVFKYFMPFGECEHPPAGYCSEYLQPFLISTGRQEEFSPKVPEGYHIRLRARAVN